jgi:hypothetical protein
VHIRGPSALSRLVSSSTCDHSLTLIEQNAIVSGLMSIMKYWWFPIEHHTCDENERVTVTFQLPDETDDRNSSSDDYRSVRAA